MFTKLDLLHLRVEEKIEKQLEDLGEELEDDAFEERVDLEVRTAVHSRCVEPLYALTSSDIPWVVTSSRPHSHCTNRSTFHL